MMALREHQWTTEVERAVVDGPRPPVKKVEVLFLAQEKDSSSTSRER